MLVSLTKLDLLRPTQKIYIEHVGITIQQCIQVPSLFTVYNNILIFIIQRHFFKDS